VVSKTYRTYDTGSDRRGGLRRGGRPHDQQAPVLERSTTGGSTRLPLRPGRRCGPTTARRSRWLRSGWFRAARTCTT
jgi:hypothetical protein